MLSSCVLPQLQSKGVAKLLRRLQGRLIEILGLGRLIDELGPRTDTYRNL